MHPHRRACPRGHRTVRLPDYQHQAWPRRRIYPRAADPRSLPVEADSGLVRRNARIRNRPRTQCRAFHLSQFLSSGRYHRQPPLLDRRRDRPRSRSHAARYNPRPVRPRNRLRSAGRSHRKTHRTQRNSLLNRVVDEGKRKADFSVALCETLCPLCCAFRNLTQRTRRKATEDRKSTRLNSSHSSISYAVFCLKKKNQKNFNITHTKKKIKLEYYT